MKDIQRTKILNYFEGMPLFKCKRVGNLVSFICPLCRKKHTHGTGREDGINPSHRNKHCNHEKAESVFSNGYFITW